LALGAGRGRLVRQFAAEGIALAGLGGAAGVWLADLAVRAVRTSGYAPQLDIRLDAWTVAYLAALTVVAAAVAGAAAAAFLTGARATGLTGRSPRTATGSPRGARVLDVCLAVEIALAVALLMSAGVLIRSVRQVTTADIGVTTDRLWTASLYLPPARSESDDARRGFFPRLVERVHGLADVEALGLGAVPPTSTMPRREYDVNDAASLERTPTVATAAIDPGYLRAVGATLVAGRAFTAQDRGDGPPVALVNRRFAERHWPDGSAVGKRVRLRAALGSAGDAPWLTVVGVVSDIVQDDRTRQAFEPIVYVPYAQHPQPNMFLFVRSRTAGAGVPDALRAAVYEADPVLPVPAIWTLDERLGRAYALESQATGVLAVFAVIALALAGAGLYVAVSHAVSRRTREIGVRMALGATGAAVVHWVASRVTRPVGIGLVSGGGAAMAATYALSARLVGVSSADPLAVAGSVAVLAGVAMAACLVPARRAVRVEPANALRGE
ncbi:MAG: ABC transporter permease, partial [Vicinamibacterales bacterium]